jgi:hypothetical protein
MASKTVANHLHRYKKVNIAGFGREPYWVYKCTKPACSHYLRMDLAEGKLCECNICKEPMIINRLAMTHSGGKPMTKPHCSNCIKRKKATDVEAITKFLDESKTEALLSSEQSREPQTDDS